MKKNGLPAGRQGFTLLEILISVGILMTVAIFLTQVLFTTTHVNKKTEILTDIKRNGNFALDVIARMVRSAKTIATSCDGGEITASTARITNNDNTWTDIICRSDGSAARIASVGGTGVTTYLSGGNVTLSESGGTNCSDSTLAFSCPPAGGGIQSELTVSFTLGALGVAGSAYESGKSSFQSTIRMRNL